MCPLSENHWETFAQNKGRGLWRAYGLSTRSQKIQARQNRVALTDLFMTKTVLGIHVKSD
jgi:hypothetical protein